MSYIDSDTIRVTFDSPIEDMTWVTITLSVDVSDSFTIGFLAGDINRDGTFDVLANTSNFA